MTIDQIQALLRDRLGTEPWPTEQSRDQVRLIVPRDQLFQTLEMLKNDAGFDMLAELTAADYLNYPNAKDRFAVIYGLSNTATGARVWLKCWLNEPDLSVPSAFPLWKGADWLEREVFDMYGIVFDGHPNLRRILMPEEFTAFPMRKDYPLRGRGERHNFPVITRANS